MAAPAASASASASAAVAAAASTCVACLEGANGTGWVWCTGSGSCVRWEETAAACGVVVVDGAANCPYDYGVPTILVIMQSFGGLAVLLLAGHLLRAHVRILRWLYMPASLLGGILGVAVLQLCYISPDAEYYLRGWTVGWADLPGFLITLVFASLFMGMTLPSLPELMYGQIVAWGLYAWPVLLTATVLVPFFGSNPLIAAIVGFGFEGGHGLAAGMGDSFASLGYPEGTDLSLAMATVGLIVALVGGTLLVNWAAHRGHVQKITVDVVGLRTVYDLSDRGVGMRTTVIPEAGDSLALHVALVGIALLFGYTCKRVLLVIEDASPWLSEYKIFSAFPVFPFCMLGGIVVEAVLNRTCTVSPIDKATLDRICGTALDFLIVAAIADMSFDSIADQIVPFVLLCIVAIAWNLLCFFWLARRLLPDYWAERALIQYGQSTGTTAQGMMLLRMVDPLYETPVMVAFSYKQLIHEPLVGSGLWTSLVLPLISVAGLWPVFGIATGCIVCWLAVFALHFRPKWARDKAALAAATVTGDASLTTIGGGDDSSTAVSDRTPLLSVNESHAD